MNFTKLLLNVFAVVLASYLVPGVHLDGFGYAVLVAALLAVLNVSLKPLLIFLTIPATILTLGLFLLVVNAIIILTADWILGNVFNVDGFWWALLFGILLTIISSVLELLPAKILSLILFFIILFSNFKIDGHITLQTLVFALFITFSFYFLDSLLQRFTTKAPKREDKMQVFDKDGKRIV
jgi:putative membrane protein